MLLPLRNDGCGMYNEFAYFYDALNAAANYRRLHRFVRRTFRRLGLRQGVVADLGCGTGKLTLALAKDGYDMLAVDLSQDMLEVLAEKLSAHPALRRRVQLLRQDLTALDLFGTVQGAVSTFDTLNHIGPAPRLEKALYDAAFFMDKDAVFVFDMNTPYKHREILRDESYSVQTPDAECVWSNRYDPSVPCTHITVRTTRSRTGEVFKEAFTEYSYTAQQVRGICEKVGFCVLDVRDGDTFRALQENSQRMVFVVQKQFTQLQQA